jgi:hypothetical protein
MRVQLDHSDPEALIALSYLATPAIAGRPVKLSDKLSDTKAIRALNGK